MRTKKVKQLDNNEIPIIDGKRYLFPLPGTLLKCPVCEQQFKATTETRYSIGKNYTCSWKCFSDFAKSYPATNSVDSKKSRKSTAEN